MPSEPWGVNNPDFIGRYVITTDIDGNPLGRNVEIVDATGNRIVVGDGESVVIENSNGDITTKIIPIAGRDGNNQARFIRTNSDGFLDVSQTELFSVFNLMLTELKILNLHLSLITDNEIREQDL